MINRRMHANLAYRTALRHYRQHPGVLTLAIPQLIRGNDQGGKTALLKTLNESTCITFFYISPHAHDVQDPATTIGALDCFWFVPNFH